MKTFASSEKGYNKQLATAFIVGMMGGSFFYRSRFKNSITEKHLYLHYTEMPKNKQYEEEEKIIKKIAALDEEFLKKISTLKCDIICRREGNNYIIHFYTGGFESLQCEISPKGEVKSTMGGTEHEENY